MNRKRKSRLRNHIPAQRLTIEQRLEWLEGMRALMFEVWKQNADLRAKYLKRRGTVW